MFKLLFKSLFIVIMTAVILTGCSQPGTTTNVVKEQNNGTTQNPDDINSLVNELKSMGFDTNGYSISDGKIFVEGDIMFDIEDLKKQISSETESSSGPMKQFRHIYTVSPQGVSDITIYADLTPEWMVALDRAIDDWNNSGTAVHFRRLGTGSPWMYIHGTNATGLGYNVASTFPYLNQDNTPGNEIIVSYYNCVLSGFNENQREHVLIHELGHTLGLRHINKSEPDRLIVPGTSTTDDTSIMSWMVTTKPWTKNPWAGFTWNDYYTNWYLFNNTTPYIILYQDTNYRGQRFLVRGNLDNLSANGYGFNDMASSIKVFNNAKVILWQHSNRGGDPCYVEWNIPSLGDYSYFNDKASSVEFY